MTTRIGGRRQQLRLHDWLRGFFLHAGEAAFPSFQQRTYKSVCQRLEDAHNKIVEMSTEQIEQRVARSLVRLVEQSGRKTES